MQKECRLAAIVPLGQQCAFYLRCVNIGVDVCATSLQDVHREGKGVLKAERRLNFHLIM